MKRAALALWACMPMPAGDAGDAGARVHERDLPPIDAAPWSVVERSGMVEVPAGPFDMGCNEAIDDQCYPQERPYHRVTLREFWIDRTEVTRGQYARCVDAFACQVPVHDWGSPPAHADFPMTSVSWAAAAQYCAWAGKSLPTEAEWEKAARGVDGRIYPWGNEPVDCTRAVHGLTSCFGAGPQPVGRLPAGASPYGALDMAGSVWEWMADWYAADVYASSPEESPTGPPRSALRVLRGGSWNYGPRFLRTSERTGHVPGPRGELFGFRCVRRDEPPAEGGAP